MNKTHKKKTKQKKTGTFPLFSMVGPYYSMLPQVDHDITDQVQALQAVEDMINLELKWKTRNIIKR